MKHKTTIFILIVLFSAFCFLFSLSVRAFESSSTNFKIQDATLESISGEGSSTDFKVKSAGGQISTGLSSGIIMKVYSGILYWLLEEEEEEEEGEEEVPPTGGGGGWTVIPSIPPEIPSIPPVAGYSISDLNRDGKVGLNDLSVLFYFMSRPIPGNADLDNDSKITIKDFSILLSQWNERSPAFAFEEPTVTTEAQKTAEKGKIIREKQVASMMSWAVSAAEKGVTLVQKEKAVKIGSKLLNTFTQFISNVYKKAREFFIKGLKK